MSSKKARRRKRREQEQTHDSRKLNPATLFILGVGVALLLLVAAMFVFGDRAGPGDPPWPGAVWSSSHGHWH